MEIGLKDFRGWQIASPISARTKIYVSLVHNIMVLETEIKALTNKPDKAKEPSCLCSVNISSRQKWQHHQIEAQQQRKIY